MKNATPFLSRLLFCFLPSLAFSQAPLITYKLQLLADGQTWGAYMKPDPSLPSNQLFLIGSAQVTVVMPLGFEWNEFTNVNGQWSPNATVEGPPENPEKSYVSFGLVTTAGWPINIVPGQETLLFKFKKVSDCPESLALFDNVTDPFNPPNSVSSNPGNDFYTWSSISGTLNYGGNYAPAAWDCHDNDGDGIANALEDTNGNGVYDPTDASNLNESEQLGCVKLKLKKLTGANGWAVVVRPTDGLVPTGNAQLEMGRITVVVPSDFEFEGHHNMAGDWALTNTLVSPANNPTRKYLCFELAGGAANVPLSISGETTLFKFDRLGDCPDSLYLLESNIPETLQANEIEGTVQTNPNLREFDLCGVYGRRAWRCNRFWSALLSDATSTNDPTGNISHPIETAQAQGLEFPNVQATNFTASPNPAGDFVDIQLAHKTDDGTMSIVLWDLQGKKRLETTLENNTYLRLGLTDLPAGVYFITLAQHGRVLQRNKLIKG